MAGMLIGVTVFAYTMSTVSHMLALLNAQSTRINDRQQQLDAFCRSQKIPAALGLKLKQYYDYVLTRQIDADDLRLVHGLSASLRQQVNPSNGPRAAR
jgi:hypothetical protein